MAQKTTQQDMMKILEACARWRNCNTYDLKTPDIYAFATFLGCPYKEGSDMIININDPDVRKKLAALNGPHGLTVQKMLEIRSKPDD